MERAVLKIKSLEAFEKAADGKATRITIPSEIQGLAGMRPPLPRKCSIAHSKYPA